MTPDAPTLFAAVDATWPAAAVRRAGPWLIREGRGGGKRVSAATAEAPVGEQDLALAEAQMLALGQQPLFMIRAGEETLDGLLAARGYAIVDPVSLLVMPVAGLTDAPVPPVTAFTIWEPLAIMREIWAAGGIGPARIDVMNRAETKTAVLLRWNEKPAGTGFVALSGDVAMVHAVEVLAHQRRQGVAAWIMRAAAFWAADQGARHIAVLCTQANGPANALYSALGFAPAGQYHYRMKPRSGAEDHG
ncbi:GNAT family N-acetyltransferase [uncultured Roseobacter sp.]|uniref:GNAT family N-acetyltransferase n=1 Tax=uncultured Roseobacter sp. TaxID=114847 RepID=UPI002605D3A8|nr:GNAT family N-acetyltransferase [uncultured Roseobacter sp.]